MKFLIKILIFYDFFILYICKVCFKGEEWNRSMCKLTEEQIEFAKNMFNDGNNTYYDVCRELENKYDVVINPESLRYYITRKDKPKVTLKDRLAIDGISKMLVISDLHVPYHRDDILDIVKKHAEEIEVLVLGGDVIDCYSISSFKPLEPKPLITEMANCHRLLKDIQSIIPDVRKIIIKGNHEERWAKYMSNMSSEVNKLHSDNIMREIVKGFESHDRQAGTITTYEPLDYEESSLVKMDILLNGEKVDDNIEEDSAIVYKGNEGLFIITGCSHSGICNIIEYAKKICNENRILGIIGGFHLFECNKRIEKTVEYLKENSIELLYPCLL